MGVWFLSSSDGLAPACLPSCRTEMCKLPFALLLTTQILIHTLCFVDRILKLLGARYNSIIVVRPTVAPRCEF